MNLKLVAMQLRPDHWSRLTEIAHARGLSASSFVRQWMAALVNRDARQKRVVRRAK